MSEAEAAISHMLLTISRLENENEIAIKALNAIKKHQEMVAGSMVQLSATFHIASKALGDISE